MKKIILFSTLANLLILANPYCYCQNVGINGSGSTPNTSALLDIDAAGMTPQKGLLIPRVPLTSTTDAVTITTPATSLLVYNTATAGTSPNNVVPGYYYNAGTSGSPNWMMFQASNANSGGCGTVQTFTSSGTWTKPACGGIAYIRCWGGGGSGGKYFAGGGGGGGYNEKWIALSSLGATETVTIGAGGAAQSSNGHGNAGGNTTFGSWLTGYGGGRGQSSPSYEGGGGGGYLGAAANSGIAGNPQSFSSYYNDGTFVGPLYAGYGEKSISPVGGGTPNPGGGGGTPIAVPGNFHGGGGGAAYDGAASTYGGGGGGGGYTNNGGAGSLGGASTNGGTGGAGGFTISGTAGTQPGGGGGGTYTGATSGAGAAGKCIIIVY